jgi:hypothetical protein
MGHATGTPKSTPSDLGLWLSFSEERQVREIEIDGETRRVRISPEGQPYVYIEDEIFRAVDDKGKLTQEFQVPGVVCADCRHKTVVVWCDSPLHPIFFGKWEPTWPTPKKSKPKTDTREYIDHLRFCGKCEKWTASMTCGTCDGPTRESRKRELVS